jgi:predicted anti-sigma-YlaC factor YlaD
VPDLTAAVLAALPADRTGAAARARLVGTALRLALLAVGVAQAMLAWPELDGVMAMSAPAHLTHETAAWNLGVAAAFLAVAAAPRLAAGALPFLGTFAVLLTAVTAADLAAGRVPADRALGHLLLLAGVALVAGLAWRGSRRRSVRAGARGRVVA